MSEGAEDRVVLDVPGRLVSVDEDGTEWFKLDPEDYNTGPKAQKRWLRKLARHQARSARKPQHT